MELTSKELHTLQMILKVEIAECDDLVKTLSGNDKKELQEHQEVVKSIYEKLNK